MGLTAFTAGFVVAGALTFAFVSRTPYDLMAYPTVVTLWVIYLWCMTAFAVRTYSVPPHPFARVSRIVVVCGAVALAALFVSIAAGMLLVQSKP
jgi:hypothetical protein